MLVAAFKNTDVLTSVFCLAETLFSHAEILVARNNVLGGGGGCVFLFAVHLCKYERDSSVL